MAEHLPSAVHLRTGLHEIAEDLRKTRHLGPESQQALADLLEELNRALDPAALPTAETAHLAESVAHLALALHERHDTGLLAAARDRLREAALRAEAAAPGPVGVARRFMDTLANLGI